MTRQQTENLLLALDMTGIEWLIVVPMSGINSVYDSFATRNRCIYVTREEEGVAVAAGLALRGSLPLLLMQQTGVGNALNAVFSLADAYEIWFPILVGDRGASDANPVQQVSARLTARVLEPLGCASIDFGMEGAPAEFRRLVMERNRWIQCSL